MDVAKSQLPVRNGSMTNLKSASLHVTEPTSLSTLIVWNISKALEKSPKLNIKEAVTSAQSRLEQISNAGDIETILSEHPYERNLACALLAWQQLGHSDADSLCRFVENKTKKEECPSKLSHNEPFEIGQSRTSRGSKISSKIVCPDIESISFETDPIPSDSGESRYMEARCFSNYNSFSMGPVVKLPLETRVVMRLDNTSRGGRSGGPPRKPRAPEKNIISKIDQACCMDSVCAERLAAMDATSAELRSRAGTLARREAERVELLERAEAAWKDLERGYQRRLALAEEKEEDIAKQITKMLEERVNYKNACTILAQELKDRSGRAEIERARLSELEKQVCERACQRMKLSEESARGDALVAEQSCRAAQLDRDLQFKEEQARRNMLSLQSEVSAMRALSCEAERATRSELGTLRDQMSEVSNKLLDEDAQNEKIKAELYNLRQEKMEIIEDLEGCKALCDGQMQGKMDELIQKRDQLAQLREKVMECRCQGPVDVAVEVKRTPSLAALCKCTPEDKILECCSCTSMRTKLLSNLFSELFEGLHSELSGAVLLMPCQLLKCLEDKHNWDRASVVKSNLKNYFSKLLVGELDIAIATSIENYHAKWVGKSCADAIKMTPGPEDNADNEGWQERAIERRAQKLASQLAEQLFQERAEELTQRARYIVQASPPPCECEIKAKLHEGCSCGSKPPSPSTPAPEAETQVYWHRAMRDVTQLRLQMEDLKKDSLRKDDLKMMENRFEKFIQLSSVCAPPERDLNVEVERKFAKKAHGKVTKHSGNLNKYEDTEKNARAPVIPVTWQDAIHDVTLLRSQIEDLKKESINKKDLKLMEDKIAKIIHRASGSMASTCPNMKYITEENLPKEVYKYSKINRAVNQSGTHFFDTDKPNASKKKIFSTIPKEIKTKPIINRGINKPYKKYNPAYAVNVCLCSTKRQEQKNLIEQRKYETSAWKQKNSKDNVSQMSSSIRRSKPINNSFLSQDISIRTYSKDYEEESCPSNCVCFHKIPSNTSIDKLLDTLAKWKGDLDASFAEKYPGKISCFNLSENNYNCPQDDKTTLESKTSLMLRVNPQEISTQKIQDLSCLHDREHEIGVKSSNTKLFEKKSGILTEPPANTDSVYMGAVNLDKSREEFCRYNDSDKKIRKTPFKCIASSKYNCEKTLEARKIEGQLMQIKTKKHKEISVIRTKQERKAKEIIALPSAPNNKEISKAQSSEKVINTAIIEDKLDTRAFKTSDYQIQFLGVTLVDVNPKTKNQVLFGSDNKGCHNMNVVPCEKYHSDNEQIRKINKYGLQDNTRPIREIVNYTNSANQRNIIINRDKKNEYSKESINNNMQSKETSELYENENISENFNKHAMLLSYMEESDISQLHKNIKYKDSDLGYKTASDQNTSNVGYDNDQLQKFHRKLNAINSNESEITKKSYKTASENYQLVDKTITKLNDREDFPEEVIQAVKQSNSYIKNIKIDSKPQMLPCKCGIQFEEFRKFIKENIAKHTDNEDVALDVQSLKYFKERDESCVCCSKLNNDECRDLEENTFNLLEEYLKKKLNDFKASACSLFCIPAEEEEKIFGLIVQRVKQLISDSTSQIACKCLTKEEKSLGSWNRAYGLLQEYLKVKIKKVQCSCLLAEDNKDTILPDILEKISNLIEYDFQRLKNICGCINDTYAQENKNNHGKQVNFEAEPSKNDRSVVFQKNFLDFSALDDKISLSTYQAIQSNHLKQTLKSQLPLTFTIDDESYNLQKTNGQDDIKHPSINSLYKHNNCDNSHANTNVELSNKNFVESDKNISESTSNKNCTKTTDVTNTETKCELKETDSSVNKTNKNIKRKPDKLFDLIESRSHPLNLVKNNSNNSKMNQKTLTNSCNIICHKKNTISANNHSPKSNDETRAEQNEGPITNSRNVPYFGYTITCSCDESLGPCICPKNTTNTDLNMINDIWKKSKANEKFFEKISYMLPKLSAESINQNVKIEDMSIETGSVSDLKKKSANNNQKSEATCCIKYEQIILKKSTDDVLKSHAETNTFKDNVSVDTDYSNNEDVKWCECTSQFAASKHADSDRLKRSIYFPASIEDFDEQLKDYISNENICGELSRKHVCDCERVPICHVKMLVENIETKLANASCTCDSLTSKVCPVHSTMC